VRARQRRLDGFAEHEVAAHQPHRLPRRGAHRGQADPLGQPASVPVGVSPGWIARCEMPSAQAEALTRKALGTWSRDG
jgi:hypothetical protein